MTAGDTVTNGCGVHAPMFNWSATLTVVRQDKRAYGVTRYVVRDRYGRHGYAY